MENVNRVEDRVEMEHFIMSPGRFMSLCEDVCGFAGLNGSTYMRHILVVAAHRIPTSLHDNIANAPTPQAALSILTAHDIPFIHEGESVP